jgi:hypothetical protein
MLLAMQMPVFFSRLEQKKCTIPEMSSFNSSTFPYFILSISDLFVIKMGTTVLDILKLESNSPSVRYPMKAAAFHDKNDGNASFFSHDL